MTTAPKPTGNPHVCPFCSNPISKTANAKKAEFQAKKYRDSYRGPVPVEMLAAMQRVMRAITVKRDFCKECGDKFYGEVASHIRKPAWMERPLG